MQSFKMQMKAATSFESGLNLFLFFTNNSVLLFAFTTHVKGNIYIFSHGHDITGHAPVLEVKLHQLQALLKIHCIDLADSTDPLAPSSHSSTTLHLQEHYRYMFGTVRMIYKDRFRSIAPLPGFDLLLLTCSNDSHSFSVTTGHLELCNKHIRKGVSSDLVTTIMK